MYEKNTNYILSLIFKKRKKIFLIHKIIDFWYIFFLILGGFNLTPKTPRGFATVYGILQTEHTSKGC
jgi:hypothetical protein